MPTTMSASTGSRVNIPGVFPRTMGPKPTVPSYKLHGGSLKKDGTACDTDSSAKSSPKPPVPSQGAAAHTKEEGQQNGNGVSPNQSPSVGKWPYPLRKTRNTASGSAISDENST